MSPNFKLVPGDRFTENELSERLGVSRTPVRQALFRLQQGRHVEVLFRSGWRVLPFDFDQFEQLYDLRMVLETTAVQRLCSDGERVNAEMLAQLIAIWLVPVAERSAEMVQVAAWDEAFHCALVAAAGNAEMARVHRDVTERIRIIRRLDFTKQAPIDATYEEHAKILKAVQRKRGDQATLLLRAHRHQPGRGAQAHLAPSAPGAAGRDGEVGGGVEASSQVVQPRGALNTRQTGDFAADLGLYLCHTRALHVQHEGGSVYVDLVKHELVRIVLGNQHLELKRSRLVFQRALAMGKDRP